MYWFLSIAIMIPTACHTGSFVASFPFTCELSVAQVTSQAGAEALGCTPLSAIILAG